MVAINFTISFTVTAVLLINIVERSYATDDDDVIENGHDNIEECKKICRELLNETKLFKMGDDEGLQNFRKSFKHYSVKLFDSMFGRGNEKGRERNRKTLKHFLVLDYFLDLFKKHGIDLSKSKMPHKWCEFKGYVPKNPVCRDVIYSVLFYGVRPRTIEESFQTLYDDWTRDELQSNKLLAKLYYVSFLRKVNKQKPGLPGVQGIYKSVGEFCDADGYELVKKNYNTL